MDVSNCLASMPVDVLRGAEAADLPIKQATKFELVVSRTVCDSLVPGIPPTLVARIADEVTCVTQLRCFVSDEERALSERALAGAVAADHGLERGDNLSHDGDDRDLAISSTCCRSAFAWQALARQDSCSTAVTVYGHVEHPPAGARRSAMQRMPLSLPSGRSS